MKVVKVLARVLSESFGIFLILVLTAKRFDTREMLALLCCCALLLSIELAVAFADPETESRSGCANVAVVATIAALSIACWPRRAVVVIYPDTYASIAAVRFK